MLLRLLVLATLGLALASAGCPSDARSDVAGGASAPEAEAPDDGEGASPPRYGSCVVDSDCEPVASSCCECPTYALPVSEGVGSLCEDVVCNGQLDCPAQEAVCGSAGTCVLACAEVSCDLSCPNGFELDDAGCATCACVATPQAPECEADLDCTQVAADCCGCSRGGDDTAVPSAEAAGFVDDLGCDGSDVCPEVDVCDASEVPTCSFGRCALVNPSLDGVAVPEVCGTAESPTCADGDYCLLNPRAYPMVAAAGLGVCLPE